MSAKKQKQTFPNGITVERDKDYFLIQLITVDQCREIKNLELEQPFEFDSENFIWKIKTSKKNCQSLSNWIKSYDTSRETVRENPPTRELRDVPRDSRDFREMSREQSRSVSRDLPREPLPRDISREVSRDKPVARAPVVSEPSREVPLRDTRDVVSSRSATRDPRDNSRDSRDISRELSRELRDDDSISDLRQVQSKSLSRLNARAPASTSRDRIDFADDETEVSTVSDLPRKTMNERQVQRKWGGEDTLDSVSVGSYAPRGKSDFDLNEEVRSIRSELSELRKYLSQQRSN